MEVAGTLCQLLKVTLEERFNYNAIYHVFSTIGLSVAFVSMMFLSNYYDKVPDRNFVQLQAVDGALGAND